MRNAWANIGPEIIDIEIKKSVLKNEICTDFFTFKVFNPIYPPMLDYLTRDEARQNEPWNFNAGLKREKEVNYQVGELLLQTKQAQFNKEKSKAKIKKTN